MPSSFKTPFLKLNKYIGKDKPKMDDTNSDNAIVDQKMNEHNQKLVNLQAHTSSTQTHITQLERLKWNKLQWEIGKYTGNGDATREINLGFQPKLGFLFQDNHILNSNFNMGGGAFDEQRCAILTSLGCSENVAITLTGFRVNHTIDITDSGRMPRLNYIGEEYIYVMFRP